MKDFSKASSKCSVTEDDLSKLIERCKKFVDSEFKISENSEDAVRALHASVRELIDDADKLGVINKEALMSSGGWIEDPVVRTEPTEDTDVPPFDIRKSDGARAKKGSFHKGNYVVIFQRSVDHVQKMADSIMRGNQWYGYIDKPHYGGGPREWSPATLEKY